MSDLSNPFTDCVQHFQVEGPGLRGRMVRVGPSLRQALTAHSYPKVVESLLGEAVAVAIALASTVKYEGIFTFQASGDGAVRTLMADVTSAGAFRCYAGYDKDRLDQILLTDGAPSLPRLMGAGYVSFTVDQGPETDRYQGITELTGGTLSDCAHHYFKQSEQIQTAMLTHYDTTTQTCGALMVQQLPEEDFIPGEEIEDSEDWRRSVILMSSVSSSELLNETLAPSEVLFRLFHEDGVRLFDHTPVTNKCRCSETKVRSTLRSFPREEIEDMQEDGIVSVTCEFCQANYQFDQTALDALYSDK